MNISTKTLIITCYFYFESVSQFVLQFISQLCTLHLIFYLFLGLTLKSVYIYNIKNMLLSVLIIKPCIKWRGGVGGKCKCQRLNLNDKVTTAIYALIDS